MNQATIAMLVIQALIKYGPSVATSVHSILSNPEPSDDEIRAMIVLSQKSYDSYIADAQARVDKVA